MSGRGRTGSNPVSGAGSGSTTNLALVGVLPPTAAPTLAQSSGSGPLTGTFYYCVSYKTASGETQGASSTSSITVSAKSVELSGIPVPSDAAVTSKVIYRTASTSTDPNKLQALVELPIGTTTYSDSIADGSLGADIKTANETAGNISLNGSTVARFSGFTLSIGGAANPNNTGYANTAVGSNALNANTNGLRNTAFGVDALYKNTTGDRNTAIGVHALDNNQTGSDNTAVGYGSLFTSLGRWNVALGSYALGNLTSGESNTSVGTFSGGYTTGGNNVAVGYNVMKVATTGSGNTGGGSLAMQSVTTGQYNVAWGFQALQALTTGDNNAAFGMWSQFSNSTANYNASFGRGALFSLASGGGGNVAFGTESLYQCVTGSYNVAVGPSAGYRETGSDTLYIDNNARATLQDAIDIGLITGNFSSTAAGQRLRLNAITRVGGSLPVVSGLPSATTALKGYRGHVTDASAAYTSANVGSTVAGGGANCVPVFCTGAAWVIG